jgi:hypothetical protein
MSGYYNGTLRSTVVDLSGYQGAMKAAADGPVPEDPTLVQKLEARVGKLKDCRKQADAQKTARGRAYQVCAEVFTVTQCRK